MVINIFIVFVETFYYFIHEELIVYCAFIYKIQLNYILIVLYIIRTIYYYTKWYEADYRYEKKFFKLCYQKN